MQFKQAQPSFQSKKQKSRQDGSNHRLHPYLITAQNHRKQKIYRNNSTLDFNERLKYAERIYRNLSEKKQTKSKSIDRSISGQQKFKASSKYKNSGSLVPSKFHNNTIKKNNFYQRDKSRQKKLVLTTNCKTGFKSYQHNEESEQLNKIKFGIKVFIERTNEFLHLKSEKLFNENYGASILRFQSMVDQQYEKQNHQNWTSFSSFIESLRKCEQKRAEFRSKALHESMKKLEKEKGQLSLKNTETLMKKQLIQKQLNQIHNRNTKLGIQLKKMKQKNILKVAVETQTQEIESAKKKERELFSSPKMANLIQELRKYKQKQQQYLQVFGILQISGINIQQIIKKFSKQNNVHQKAKLVKYKSLIKNQSSKQSQRSNNSSISSEYVTTRGQPKYVQANIGPIPHISSRDDEEADQSIISSIEALSFNYRDKIEQPQLYSPRVHHQTLKPLDQNLQNQLQLNFSCLYTDYDEQLFDDIESEEQQQVRNKKDGCPTV